MRFRKLAQQQQPQQAPQQPPQQSGLDQLFSNPLFNLLLSRVLSSLGYEYTGPLPGMPLWISERARLMGIRVNAERVADQVIDLDQDRLQNLFKGLINSVLTEEEKQRLIPDGVPDEFVRGLIKFLLMTNPDFVDRLGGYRGSAAAAAFKIALSAPELLNAKGDEYDLTNVRQVVTQLEGLSQRTGLSLGQLADIGVAGLSLGYITDPNNANEFVTGVQQLLKPVIAMWHVVGLTDPKAAMRMKPADLLRQINQMMPGALGKMDPDNLARQIYVTGLSQRGMGPYMMAYRKFVHDLAGPGAVETSRLQQENIRLLQNAANSRVGSRLAAIMRLRENGELRPGTPLYQISEAIRRGDSFVNLNGQQIHVADAVANNRTLMDLVRSSGIDVGNFMYIANGVTANAPYARYYGIGWIVREKQSRDMDRYVNIARRMYPNSPAAQERYLDFIARKMGYTSYRHFRQLNDPRLLESVRDLRKQFLERAESIVENQGQRLTRFDVLRRTAERVYQAGKENRPINLDDLFRSIFLIEPLRQPPPAQQGPQQGPPPNQQGAVKPPAEGKGLEAQIARSPVMFANPTLPNVSDPIGQVAAVINQSNQLGKLLSMVRGTQQASKGEFPKLPSLSSFSESKPFVLPAPTVPVGDLLERLGARAEVRPMQFAMPTIPAGLPTARMPGVPKFPSSFMRVFG